MEIKFKNLVEIETFAKMAEQYNGDVILTNGGTGLASRDITVETVESLFEKRIDVKAFYVYT